MRTLLIQPPYDLQATDERQAMAPLGLAYIAAMLQRAGVAVAIVDCVAEDFQALVPLADGRRRHGLAGAALAKRIAEYAPDLVGVSCLFSAQADAAHETCRLVKAAAPQARVIVGGAHPSAAPKEVLADPNVDAVGIGEGENLMVRIAQALQRGVFPPENVDGLAFRAGGRVHVHPQTERISELDTLPFPARNLLPMQAYFKYRAPHGGVVRRHPCTNMITSRGCPAQCSFCSIHNVWGRKFRCHSAEYVIREIESLIRDYGVREIQFEDDNLTLRRNRIQEICQRILERGIDITWSTPNGVAAYALDEETLALMRAAGCHHITLGIESGSEHTLKHIIRKPVRLERVRPIIASCRKLGLGVSAFFVVGFPGETRVEMQKTFDLALDLDIDTANIFVATPYPGTRMYDQCVAEELMATPVDYTKLRIGLPILSTRDWTAQELRAWVTHAQAEFYRRAARRHPVRFFRTVVSKFVREPAYILRKARETLLAGGERAATV